MVAFLHDALDLLPAWLSLSGQRLPWASEMIPVGPWPRERVRELCRLELRCGHGSGETKVGGWLRQLIPSPLAMLQMMLLS